MRKHIGELEDFLKSTLDRMLYEMGTGEASIKSLPQKTKAQFLTIAKKINQLCINETEQNLPVAASKELLTSSEIEFLRPYLFLYIELMLDGLMRDVDWSNECIRRFKILERIFKDEIFRQYLPDLYLVRGDFETALELYSALLDPCSTRTHLANTVLNLKYVTQKPIAPADILCLERKITTLGMRNIERIVPAISKRLRDDETNSNADFLQYFGKKYIRECRYPVNFFGGYRGNYAIQVVFEKQPYAFQEFCFYAIPEFVQFCHHYCRAGENDFRSSVVGMRQLANEGRWSIKPGK